MVKDQNSQSKERRDDLILENAKVLVDLMEKVNPNIWEIFLYTHGLNIALSKFVSASPFNDGSPVELPLLKEARTLDPNFGSSLSNIELHRCIWIVHKIVDERKLLEKHFDYSALA